MTNWTMEKINEKYDFVMADIGGEDFIAYDGEKKLSWFYKAKGSEIKKIGDFVTR